MTSGEEARGCQLQGLAKVKYKKAKSTKQHGKVISQSKKPKTQLDPGTKVNVVVGK